MRVLGIDPGYDRLGLALIEQAHGEREKVIFSTCLTAPRTLDFNERLWLLVNKVEDIIKRRRPDILTLEKIFLSTNHKTAIAVAEVRGAILYLARKFNVPVINLTPLEVKITITGYGQASKDQVKRMLERLLIIKQPLGSDDEADALAIALTGLARTKQVYPVRSRARLGRATSNGVYPQPPPQTIAKKSNCAKK